MPAGEKPYRVYRGGRARGRVPLERRSVDGRRDGHSAQQPKPPRQRRRVGWRRVVAAVVVLLLLATVTWAVLGYLALRKGVEAANERLSPAARRGLVPQEGLLLSRPTTFLLLGTDHADTDERVTFRRSDSMMLVRTDPDRHRIAYLTIPRDLKVQIPGHGDDKVNAAFQIGGAALAVRTVRSFTGLPVNHVLVVDFDRFRELIDTLGGITVDVPAPILSNRFDCPYPPARCERWQGWRFAKGRQRMDGRRALVYARIRQNRLDPSESDVTRGERQQRVLQALTAELSSPRTLARMPFIGDELLRPLATDLTAAQFTQLAWVKFRAPADRALHCRLGGSASDVGGQSFIVSTQENFSVIQMFVGQSAPQPPSPGSGPFGPGCVVGSRAIGRR